MTNMQVDIPAHRKRSRRRSLALLGAAALVLAGLTAPLGGTAYAGGNGGVSGDPPESRPPKKPKLIGDDVELSFDAGLVARGPGAGDFQIAGEKPNAGVAGNRFEAVGRSVSGDGRAAGDDSPAGAIDTIGRKVGASGGAVVQDPPRPTN